MKNFRLLFTILFFYQISCSSNFDANQTVRPLDACYDYADDRTPVDDEGNDLLVSGEIVRETKDTSYNGPLFFTDESVGTISLECGGWDKPSTLFVQKHIRGKFTFPYTFELRGSLPEFKNYTMCFISLGFFRQSTKVCVGDLVNEYSYRINKSTNGMKLEVTGLESCQSPNAGGFCLGSPRTF